jgi:hypothetical protein
MGRAPQGTAAANSDIVDGCRLFHGRERRSLWGEGQDGLTHQSQTGFVARPRGGGFYSLRLGLRLERHHAA